VNHVDIKANPALAMFGMEVVPEETERETIL